jgi:PAS domain S-box-containing protein
LTGEGTTGIRAQPGADRLRAAELVAELSRRFVEVPAKDIHGAIEGALRIVAEAHGFESGEVAMFSHDRQSFTVTHRYSIPEFPDHAFPVGEPRPFPDLPWLAERLIAARQAVVGSGAMPEEAVVENGYVRALGIGSWAFFPLIVGGDVLGAVTFTARHPMDVDPNALRLVVELFASALDRKRTDDALRERLRFLERLADLSRRFVDLPAKHIHRGLKEALRIAAEAQGFERCMVLTLSDDRKSVTITHRYSSPDFQTALFPVGEPLLLTEIPWLTPRIFEQREAVIGYGRLPEDALAERDIHDALSIRRWAYFPLVVGGTVLGAVAFLSRDDRPVDADALRLVVELFASALDRQRVDEVLQERLRLTELVADISRRLIELPPAEIGKGIDDGLRRLGELYGFRRVNVYEISDDGTTSSITHRYLAPGVEATVPLNVERPAERYGYVLSRLVGDEAIVLARDTLPPEAAAEREDLILSGTAHAVAFPLRVGGTLLGSVTVEMDQPAEARMLETLGVIRKLLTTAVDRKRAERTLEERLRFEEALSEISAKLVGRLGDSFDRTIIDAFGAVGRALEFDRVAVFDLTQDGRFFALANEWCAPGIERFARSTTGLPIDEFGWPLTELRRGRPIIFGPNEIPADALACRSVVQRDGTKLMAFVPLVVSGEILGCIGFHRLRSGRRLSEHQFQRLKLVGEIVADAMGRRSAEALLRRSEARFAKVIASALDGVALVDETGVVLEWAPQAERLLGYPRSEMLGSPLSNVLLLEGAPGLHPDGPNDLLERAQSAPGGRLELLGKTRDGRSIPIELSISLLESTEAAGYAIFIRDITDRKRAEQVRQQAFEEIARLKVQIERERDYLREEIRTEHQLGEFVGQSEPVRALVELVDQVASTSATVLIRGESGVGKELVARAIHARSRRADGPLVKVNCASIPKELFESEFFGHVRGAFTGAHRDRIGRFELANRGTLFLDEVGEIPLALQSKLLRVLQESEFERVGDDRTRRVDVRVIAATNRDLEAEAGQGTFRKDLYYRLSVFPIDVPALRHRREDIQALAEHFLEIHARALGRKGLVLDEEHRRLLEAYDWPGNVRELAHVIERAVILSPRPPLRLDLALKPSSAPQPAAEARLMTDAELRSLERANLVSVLERCGWQVSGRGGAAELLGVNASTLRDRMRAFDVRKPESDAATRNIASRDATFRASRTDESPRRG